MIQENEANKLVYTHRLRTVDIGYIIAFLRTSTSRDVILVLERMRWSFVMKQIASVALGLNPFVFTLTVHCRDRVQRFIRSQDTIQKIHSQVRVMREWFKELVSAGLTAKDKSSFVRDLGNFILNSVIGVDRKTDFLIAQAMCISSICHSIRTIDTYEYIIPITHRTMVTSLQLHQELVRNVLVRCKAESMKMCLHFQVGIISTELRQTVTDAIVRVFKEMFNTQAYLFEAITISDINMYRKVFFLIHARGDAYLETVHE